MSLIVSHTFRFISQLAFAHQNLGNCPKHLRMWKDLKDVLWCTPLSIYMHVT